jgi:hypothetical protein
VAKLSSFVQKSRTKAAIFTTPLGKALYAKRKLYVCRLFIVCLSLPTGYP